VVALTEGAQELAFDADSSLLPFIHLGLNTFKAGGFSTATQVYGQSALAIEV